MNKANDVMVVEDYVDTRCVRHVHWMSNKEFSPSPCPLPVGEGKITREDGVWHFRAEYPYRGVLDIQCNCWKKHRRFVVWSIDGYSSVTAALLDAWREYGRLFHGEPEFAFIRSMPKSIENGIEVGGMCFFEAEWMPERCVAVGCWSIKTMVGITAEQ